MAEEKKAFHGQDPAPADAEGAHADDNDDLGPDLRMGDLYVTTASHSKARAETAMPGTASIAPLLTLVPPPVDEDILRTFAEDDGLRDYGPDPVAEYALAVPARAVFPVASLSAAITPDLYRYFANPTFYVRTPAGRVTYMNSADGPKQAAEIIAGWRLATEDKDPVQNIVLGAHGLAGWLAARREGFAAVAPDPVRIAAQHQAARRIIEIAPNNVYIVAQPQQRGGRFDGQKVWHTLHALGVRWGDCDQFQWGDQTNQTDYLFWVEVDDGEFGYALPEEIAAGRQHFQSARFGFDIARTPHPAHVLQQMARAAECFAVQLDGQLICMIDDDAADGLQALETVVSEVAEKLQACSVKPGSSSVCMLR